MAGLLTGIRILVVEDHDDTRDILEQSLRFEGAAVQTTGNAADALGALDRVDIVVTDFALPHCDGIWLLEQIAHAPRAVPVILLSGYAPQQVDALAQAPFARKLLKPVDPWELGAEIRKVLGRP